MNELGGYAFDDLRVGMWARFAKTITEADIVLFTAVSGDNNAIHINEEFAASTIFKGRIAHGMLSASVISAAIANKLPGPGSIYVSQSLRFRVPVRARDTVRATVTVKEMIPARPRLARHGLHAADAIELNIYFIPADTAMTGRASSSAISISWRR
jgi:3-hydroxybutyryl-CoA dehydratase